MEECKGLSPLLPVCGGIAQGNSVVVGIIIMGHKNCIGLVVIPPLETPSISVPHWKWFIIVLYLYHVSKRKILENWCFNVLFHALKLYIKFIKYKSRVEVTRIRFALFRV